MASQRKPLPHARRRRRERQGAALLATTLVGVWQETPAHANPEGMTVVKGNATANASGPNLTLQVGAGTFLDWHSFNIRPGETTTFVQPGAGSIVFNRINDTAPSEIWGGLRANGTVVLANRYGFYFGPASSIQVGGFIATTAPITPDLGAGGLWQFSGLPPSAAIENHGQIRTREGGSLFLIAERVENHGSLEAPSGGVGLYSGREVLVSDRPDGRGLSASVVLPEGSVNNHGSIIADAGTIALQARVVNQGGVLQANSVREHNGAIELVASESVTLQADSRIAANGAPDTPSAAGRITIRSEGTFLDAPGSRIEASGGAGGGNGGRIELSAAGFGSLATAIDAHASAGYTGGSLLLDPTDIILNRSGTGDAGNGTVASGAGPGTLQLNVDTAFLNKNLSQITLQATRNITLAQGTTWNLSQSTGTTDDQPRQLTLQAGNNIVFENGTKLLDARNWSVTLEAGVDFGSGLVRSGSGSILLNSGTGTIETSRGSLQLTAGKDILVGSGGIRTSGGGSITAHAIAGDINAGTRNDGFEYLISGYRVSQSGPGGIATAQGGDVTLEAGRDVLATPTPVTGQTPGGSGAYGSQPGDVHVTAGRNITGSFIVRNGTGTLEAGVVVEDGHVAQVVNPEADIGAANKPASLSLVAGRWLAYAARNLFLSEIRNPNGTFNRNKLPVPVGQYAGNAVGDTITPVPDRQSFLFDYAADAGASLWAGQGITLVGANLPRITGLNQSMPAVYPPSLRLEAGAGGIEVDNTLILFPSTQGSLELVTHDGGSLIGRQVQSVLVGITMSDSGLPGYATFAEGHAVTPLHAGSAEAVVADISGGVRNFALTVPLAAHVQVAGDTYNFGFLGQNVTPGTETRIDVGGDVRYRGNLTEVPLADPLPAEMLDRTLSANPTAVLKLSFDPVRGQLSYVGQMPLGDLEFFLAPQQIVLDPYDGKPLVDHNGLPVTRTLVLNDLQKAALRSLYDNSQDASLVDNGLILSGPGRFHISAHNMDLGISQGIVVRGSSPALQRQDLKAADLDLHLGGDLDMTSTKIANEGYQGAVRIETGGKVDVGAPITALGDAGVPKGIFTTSGGSVDLIATGDINVNGSRIATYNGGDIHVRSQEGDVNAGSGAFGYVTLNSQAPDPATGLLRTLFNRVPGSGILATTLAGTDGELGDVRVETPGGSIHANLGGILQVAQNNGASSSASIVLEARDNIDAGGSGVIGTNIRLKAGGDITGMIVGSRNVDIGAGRNVNVTAFAAGSVSINAGATISGTVVGGGNLAVSGDSITAALVSKSVAASGDASAASVGVPSSNVARSEARVAEDTSATLSKARSDLQEDAQSRRRNTSAPTLRRTVGRVTVILPNP
jgi:filamentous hemagglutinin family protein